MKCCCSLPSRNSWLTFFYVPLLFVCGRWWQNFTVISVLILKDASKSQCTSQTLKVRFKWTLGRALKKLTRATGCMTLGGGDFWWGLLYPVTALVIRVPQISLIGDWRSEFGHHRMFAGSQGVEKIWIKLYSIQRHVGHSNDFHYPCGHHGWWSSLRFNHKN